jgi:hypothetical protein
VSLRLTKPVVFLLCEEHPFGAILLGRFAGMRLGSAFGVPAAFLFGPDDGRGRHRVIGCGV